jgi:2,5-dioxopentanoate dehydrogenase
VRPVAYQNTPQDLLPPTLRDNNPLGITRLVDGKWTDQAIDSQTH